RALPFEGDPGHRGPDRGLRRSEEEGNRESPGREVAATLLTRTFSENNFAAETQSSQRRRRVSESRLCVSSAVSAPLRQRRFQSSSCTSTSSRFEGSSSSTSSSTPPSPRQTLHSSSVSSGSKPLPRQRGHVVHTRSQPEASSDSCGLSSLFSLGGRRSFRGRA